MYAEDTKRIVVYLNARRSSVDRQVLARLRGDAARGKSASGIVRQALAEHYGLERPTPAPDSEALRSLTAQLAVLVETVAKLQDQLATLQHQATQAQHDAHQLRLALVGVVYGDREQQRQGRAVASAALAALTTNATL